LFSYENKAELTIILGSKSRSRKTEIFDLVQTFHAHCKAYLTEYEAQDLFHQASVVLDGFILEQRLRQGRLTLDLETYMSIRQRTIALAPMISLARSEYPPEIYPEELLNMQHDLSIVLGLQNDLVGLDKDIENGEFMNAVVVLLRDTPRTNVHISTENISDALHSIVDVYEQALSRLLYQHRQLTNSKKGHVGSTAAIADVQLCLVETHLKWCISAKRYRTEITQ
jgi:hypothetical protein